MSEVQTERSSVPAFARPTASKLIKESIPDSEVKANKNVEQITKQVTLSSKKKKHKVIL